MNIIVNQLPEIIKDLGDVPICKTETFKVCGKSFTITDQGIQTGVICQGTGSTAPKSCDTSLIFNIVPVLVTPVLNFKDTLLNCPKDSVLISACSSTFTPAVGTTLTYQWKLDGVILNGQKSCSIVAKQPGKYAVDISITYTWTDPAGKIRTKTCVETDTVRVRPSLLLPPETPIIQAPNQMCADSTYSFTILNKNTNGKYTWIHNTDTLSFSSSTISLKVKGVGDKLCVFFIDNCNQKSNDTCLNLNILESPKNTMIVGDTIVCGNVPANYCVLAPVAGETYTWTLPTGATFTNTASNCIEVNWGAIIGQTTICVKATNSCGTHDTCVNVYITGIPNKPGPINGSLQGCFKDTSTFSVPFVQGVSKYNWNVQGGTIVNGINSNNIVVVWDTTGNQKVCVSASNNCGTSAEECLNILVTKKADAPNISGLLSVCEKSNQTYSIPTLNTNEAAIWTVTGGNIISGQNTNSIQVNWNVVGSTGKVCVEITNECGPINSCININVIQQPIAKVGIDKKACGLSANLDGLPSVGNGFWTLVNAPTNGTANFNNPINQNTGVSVNNCGIYSFQWTENNMGCKDSIVQKVNFIDNPKAASILEVCNPAQLQYTVSFNVIGCANTYTIKDGNGTVLSNLTTSPFTFTSSLINESTPYTFQIIDNEGCISASITGIKNCNCPTKAGTMANAVIEVCENQTGTAIHNVGTEVLDPDDTFEFVLHTNTGTQLGTLLDRNQTGTFGFLAGMQYETTYYISYVAGNKLGTQVDLNDPCKSVSPGQPIIFHQNPISNAGVDAEFCGLNATLAAIPNLGAGSWTLLSGSAGTINFIDNKIPNTSITANQFGKYQFEWLENNKGCFGKDTVEITFNPDNLAVSNPTYLCDASGQNYTATITISNGSAPYQVNGSPLVGNTFTTNSIPTGINDSIVVVDGKGCKSVTIPLFKVCDCKTDVTGLIITNTIICESDTVEAFGTSVLDPTDDFLYIISDNCNVKAPNFNILESNKTGKFNLTQNLTCGKTYQLIYVAGNKDVTTGNIDFKDPCLDFECIPFVFICNPKVDAGFNKNLCQLTTTLAGTNTVGNITWTQQSGTGNAVFSNNKALNSNVTVDVCGKYSFLITADNGGCKKVDSVQIEFNEKPILTNVIATCDPTFTNFTVKLDVNSCSKGVLNIAGMSGGTITNNVFTSNTINAGIQNFKFVFTDPIGCKDSISGTKKCDCATSAGTMPNTLLKVCVPSSGIANISTKSDGNYVLDANDTYEYLLTDNITNPFATVLDRNKTGVFNYKASLTFGKTYYIVFVVNDSLANGNVDISTNTKCLVYVSTPIEFYQCPELKCPTDQNLDCILSATLTSTSNAGTGTWTISSKPLNTNVVFSNPNNDVTTVTVDKPGVYRFKRVVKNDIFVDSCESQITFSITAAPTLVVNSTNYITDCKDTSYVVNLQMNGTPPFTLLSGSSAANFSGNKLTSAPIKSESNYIFIIKDSKSCDSTIIQGTFKTKCKSFAGTPTGNISICAPIDTAIFLPNLLVGEEPNGKWESTPSIFGLFDTFFTRNISPGVYTLRYIIPGKSTPPSFEGDTATFVITLNSKPTADAGLDQTINCKVASVPIGGLLTSQGSNIAYNWSGGSVGNPSQAITNTSVGGKYVLNVRDILTGCFAKDTVEVIVKNGRPTASSNVIDVSCPGLSDGLFSINLTGGAKPYKYAYQTTGYNNASTDILTFSALKAGDYSIKIIDANECTWDTVITIKEGKPISVDLGSDVEILLGDTVNLKATINNYSYPNEIDTIKWKFYEKDTAYQKLDLTVKPTQSGRYCIYVKSTKGCEASNCVWVGVSTKYPVYIPNTFSPNDDTYNDRFVPYGDPRYVKSVESFAVFDRWGNQMYHANNFDPGDETLGWDGTFNGKKMNPGVYVFHAKIIFIDGTIRVFKGDVTLIDK
ncbi:MAG: gliding motility-associated C-terminal domain-containing protein [Saprospiraceae bacterium]|nr:gliding motility-associated C-terminal domain-containing protein [Saprospiraceae bacterium]